MTTQSQSNSWGFKSVSYWGVLLIAAGIIFIGVRFILNPEIGAEGYGILFQQAEDAVYGKIKGVRDIFSGLVLLPFLILRMRKIAAWIFTISIFVPVADFLLVLSNNGSGDISHLIIHGSTALFMIITSVLLFRKKAQVERVDPS